MHSNKRPMKLVRPVHIKIIHSMHCTAKKTTELILRFKLLVISPELLLLHKTITWRCPQTDYLSNDSE